MRLYIMHMNIKTTLLAILICICHITYAQPVARNVVVEHFTNTYCSVCASRNPGFYANLQQHPGIMHIAYHPSLPYNACPLNQHNRPENDDRTKLYNVFGATPQLVIQGEMVPNSTNFNDPAIFQNYTGQMSAFDMQVRMEITGGNMLEVTTVIRKVAASSLSSLLLFGALVEDTLFFAANNGEQQHYDVFRKALWTAGGTSITAPANIGDSVVMTATVATHSAWNIARIYSMAMLQETNLQIVQAQRSNYVPASLSVANMPAAGRVELYPNPATSEIYINAKEPITQIAVYNVTGALVLKQGAQPTHTKLNISQLAPGLYEIVVTQGGQLCRARFVKQ